MKVLLAADGSEPALAALGLMEAVGRRSGLTVTALSVASLSTVTPDWPPASLEGAVTKDAERARGIASAAAQRLHDAGFTAESETAEGHAGEQIVAAVEHCGYGLTVMGSGRHRWLSSRLLGSTGTFVLHACPASVLLVHEPPPAGEPCRVLVATDGSAWSRLAVSVF